MKHSASLASVIALSLGAALALAPVSTAAQQQGDTTASLMTAERSWAIQATLAEIDRDKGGFVDALIAAWQPYVDNKAFDLSADFKRIALKAPAWQLYGASLIGDFGTMVRVLRGFEGASTYINTLSHPQAKSFAYAPSQLLGSYVDSLVFTPIPPCRIVDTRGTGARTGLLTAGVPRVFDLTTDGYAKGQGGQTAGCTGLPSYSHLGFAVNVTATGYAANGGLQVYPYLGAVPLTSLINFFPAAYALANNGTVTGCDGCTDDITVLAFGASSHVIIDVMGYYQRAAVSNAGVSNVAGTPVNVATAGFNFAYGGACPAGTVLIGGEMDHDTGDMVIGESAANSATVWRFWMVNNSGALAQARAYSRCLDQPIQIP